MKVSIIIPLYNKAPYITQALNSVLAQSFADYECLIINDGSTDNSEAVVQSWLAQYSQYTVHFTLYTQENAGVSAARNHGISLSTGEYVCFLDGDDWWEPMFLEKMVSFAEQYSDAGLWASNYIYYKPGKTRVGVTNVAYTEAPYINYPRSYYHGTGMPIWTGAVMMRRSVFDEMGGFPEGIRLGEDFLLWAKAAQRYPIAFLDKPLAYYNNDVPASLRATRNLHAPEHHMLWHLNEIDCFWDGKDDEVMLSASVGSLGYVPLASVVDWRMLLDKLRVCGLLDYWLDDRYHDAAAEQLNNVDWAKQPKSVVKFYHSPLWILRTKRSILQFGSYCKQKLIKMRK